MSFKKNFFGLLLISLAISGFECSQRITIPLKSDVYGYLSFTAQFGTGKCKIDFNPSIRNCLSNVITKKFYEIEDCGSQLVGKSNFIERGTIYTSPFSLGNVQAPLSFVIPPPLTLLGNVMCFVNNDLAKEENILAQLFKEGKISEKRVFFSLNMTYVKNEYIGEMHIGAPNEALIKKGAKLLELAALNGLQVYTALSNGRIQSQGHQLFSPSKVNFSLYNYCHQFPKSLFNQMISIFKEQGIENDYDPRLFKPVFLTSIEKLKPIELILLLRDHSEFLLTIQPSQYTLPFGPNKYKLLIQANDNLTDSIDLSYKIFESYYVGFNLEGNSISIAEKEPIIANIKISQVIN